MMTQGAALLLLLVASARAVDVAGRRAVLRRIGLAPAVLGGGASLASAVDLDPRALVRPGAGPTAVGPTASVVPAAAVVDPARPGVGTTVILKNGLRFTDRVEGSGRPLRYGQMVEIAYTAYTRATTGAPVEKVDESKSYLVKHGNGRLIRGLDEGLHTMHVGGVRRVEVPPSLAFTAPGLGPIPGDGRKRHFLSEKVDAVLEDGGAIIYDVTIKDTWVDDADQGFYDDLSFDAKDLNKIVETARKQILDFKLVQ